MNGIIPFGHKQAGVQVILSHTINKTKHATVDVLVRPSAVCQIEERQAKLSRLTSGAKTVTEADRAAAEKVAQACKNNFKPIKK